MPNENEYGDRDSQGTSHQVDRPPSVAAPVRFWHIVADDVCQTITDVDAPGHDPVGQAPGRGVKEVRDHGATQRPDGGLTRDQKNIGL